MEDLEIQPLESYHDRAAFSSGEPSLDSYIRVQASQDERRDLARCYVLVQPGTTRVIGYYTLNTLSVELTAVPKLLSARLGRYRDVPAILIGRLAIDREYQRQGLGEHLLIDAFRQIIEFGQGVGIALIVVDAINEAAAKFYEKYGFLRLEDSSRLYLPLRQVRSQFTSES